MTDEQITQVREILQLAANTFGRYEDLHREKGTEDGNRKANANAALMLRMEEALALLPAPAPESAVDEVEKVAAQLRADTQMMAHNRWDMGMSTWNSVSNNILRAADLLDAERAARVRVEEAAIKALDQYAESFRKMSCEEYLVDRLTFGGASDNVKLADGRAQGIELARDRLAAALQEPAPVAQGDSHE
ncbi:MAG: hypothetical protein IPK75_12540 [Acidobacteria bacterium]|nr:hypothetical protein [Acidobacteriota bacterium]